MKKFEIYEKSQRGTNGSLNARYNKQPIISVSGSDIRFNEVAEDRLRLVKHSEILISKSDDGFYLANVSEHNRDGYKLNRSGKLSTLSTQSKSFIERLKIKKGIYLIDGFAEYDEKEKIDWFRLIPIEN